MVVLGVGISVKVALIVKDGEIRRNNYVKVLSITIKRLQRSYFGRSSPTLGEKRRAR